MRANDRAGRTASAPLPEWSEDAALALMDRAGIATAVLSVSSPGVHFGDDAAARVLTPDVNEVGAGRSVCGERFAGR